MKGCGFRSPEWSLNRASRSLGPSPTRNGSPSLQRCVSVRTPSASQVGGIGNSTSLEHYRTERKSRERPMSVAGSSRSTIPLLPNLTPSQVLTIRKSWKHINTKGLRTVIRLCFQRLESGSKAVTLAFSSVNNELSTSQAKVRTIANHVKFLVNLIDRIIDGNEAVVSELKTVGASHGFLKEKYGFGVQDLEKFGELMVEAFVDLDGIKQSKETVRNWRLLIASLIDQLRVGFDNQLRMERRHSTASFSCLASPSSYSENLADSRFRRRSIPTYDRSRWSESDPSSRRNRSNS